SSPSADLHDLPSFPTRRSSDLTGRPKEQVQLVEAYMKEQGLFHSAASPEPVYSDTLSLDLASVEPSLAGPRRPQDRVALGDVPRDRKSTRLNSSHLGISYAVFC